VRALIRMPAEPTVLEVDRPAHALASATTSSGAGARCAASSRLSSPARRRAGAAMAARLAAYPAQLDGPEPGTEVTRADLLELD